MDKRQNELPAGIYSKQFHESQANCLGRQLFFAAVAVIFFSLMVDRAPGQGTVEEGGGAKAAMTGEAAQSQEDPATQDQKPASTRTSPIHIVPYGPPAQPMKIRPAASAASSNQGLVQYWGGPVISNVQVVEVLWGSFVDVPSTTGLDQFYTDVTASNYFSLLAEYGTVGLTGAGTGSPPGSNQTIGPGTFGGMFTITPSLCPGSAANPACTITDAQIQTELTSQVGANHLPQPTQDGQGNFNTIYMIYFPPGVTIRLAPGANSCQLGGFCAYHSNVLTGSKLPYGVYPDFGPTSGCSLARGGCGGGPTSHDNLTAASSHELAEAVTDVDVGTANSFAPPLAWADQASQGEIGDFCNQIHAQITANGNTHIVQAVLSNMQGECVSAPAQFKITGPTNAVPGEAFTVTVAPETSDSAPVAMPGYNNTVAFTSSDTATGVVLPPKYTFVPATDQGSHTFSVTLQTLGSQTVSVNDTQVTTMVGAITLNVAHNPDMTIVSSHLGNFRQGDAGDTYTLTVSNGGDTQTNALVTVTDSLPAGLTATAIGGTGWTCQSLPTLSCTRSDVLNPKIPYPPITLTVNVSPTATPSLVNSAQVSGGGEVNTFNDVSTDPTIVIQVADMVVAKSHSGSFSQGQIGETYTLVASNVGTGPTSAPVTVTDTLPPGLTATAISGAGWSCTLATLSCTRSDILAPNGQYPPVVVTVNIASTTPTGTVTNTASVAGGGEVVFSNDSASDPTTITAPSPDLSITSIHNGNFTQGQTGVTYTLMVANAGTQPTTGGATVTVTDNVPSAALTITAMTGTGWTCNLSGVPTCVRSDVLAPASTYPPITVTANVNVTAPPSAVNSVAVSGGGEADSGDSFADPTTIVQLADMTVSSDARGSFLAGSTGVEWTISASNVGAAATSAPVTVAATLTTGVTATAITGPGWTCTLSTLTCTRSDILAASGIYPPITVTLNYAATARSSTQTATVSGGGEVNTANDTVSSTVVLTPQVSMLIPNPTATVTAGSPASYMLFVTSLLPGVVHMSCTGLPTGANCNFNNQDIISPVFLTESVIVTTTAPAVAAGALPGTNHPSPLYALLFAVIVMLGVVARAGRKKHVGWVIRLRTVTAIVLAVGCGGSSSKPPPPVPTAPGTYTITIVANNATTNTQASGNVTLIVK